MKFWVGWATRSLSLLADSLHTMLDCFSVLLSLTAIGSLRQTSGQDIRGHSSIETAAVLLVAAVLGLGGFSLLGVSLYQFRSVLLGSLLVSVNISLPVVLLLSIISAIHLCLVLFERYESRVLRNSMLRHNASTMLRDAWLTVLLLLGLVGVSQGYTWLDSLMAIGLILMLIPSFWHLLKRQLPSLVHQMAVAPEILVQLASQIEGVAECHRVRSQGVIGRQVFVQMHLLLHPEFMAVAHLIVDRLKRILRERYGSVQTKIYVKENIAQPKRWWNFLKLNFPSEE
jgi:cation diffusion facilitator family transporter